MQKYRVACPNFDTMTKLRNNRITQRLTCCRHAKKKIKSKAEQISKLDVHSELLQNYIFRAQILIWTECPNLGHTTLTTLGLRNEDQDKTRQCIWYGSRNKQDRVPYVRTPCPKFGYFSVQLKFYFCTETLQILRLARNSRTVRT